MCLLEFWDGGCHGQPQELQDSVRETVTKSPSFDKRYREHFAQPEQAFDAMRDNLLDGARELAEIARRLRGESSQ